MIPHLCHECNHAGPRRLPSPSSAHGPGLVGMARTATDLRSASVARDPDARTSFALHFCATAAWATSGVRAAESQARDTRGSCRGRGSSNATGRRRGVSVARRQLSSGRVSVALRPGGAGALRCYATVSGALTGVIGRGRSLRDAAWQQSRRSTQGWRWHPSPRQAQARVWPFP